MNEAVYSAPTMPDGYCEIGSPEQIAALYTAFCKAQSDFGEIHRSKTVDTGKYKFKYSPLEDLLEATRPALILNGIAVLTPIMRQSNDTSAKVCIILAHEGGGRVLMSFAFTPHGEMKDVAGQITYLRRYGYSAALNLAADDDDEDQPEQRAPRSQRAAQEPSTPKQPEKPIDPLDPNQEITSKNWEQFEVVRVLQDRARILKAAGIEVTPPKFPCTVAHIVKINSELEAMLESLPANSVPASELPKAESEPVNA